jgi:ABC-type multidrug transport system fused ATPase/permease subunit
LFSRLLLDIAKLLTKLEKKNGKFISLSLSIREALAITILVFVVLCNGYYQIINSSDLLIVLMLIYRGLNSLMTSFGNYNAWTQSSYSLLTGDSEIKKLNAHQSFSRAGKNPIDNSVVLINLSKSSDGSPILDNINMSIKSNTSVGIIGKSGSGKTSLLDIIATVSSHTSGKLILGGENVNDLNIESWRDKIGYVSQDSQLYNGSLAENISLCFNASIDKYKIDECLKLVQMYDFIYKLPYNINTKLDVDGFSFSNGQKQRILIARELYKSAEILILDEATNALDSKTEIEIKNNIKLLKGRLTLIVVSHGYGILEDMDEIYVLDSGRIINSTTYSDLVKS